MSAAPAPIVRRSFATQFGFEADPRQGIERVGARAEVGDLRSRDQVVGAGGRGHVEGLHDVVHVDVAPSPFVVIDDLDAAIGKWRSLQEQKE